MGSKDEKSEGGLITPTSANTQAILSICFSILCRGSHSQANPKPRMAAEALDIMAVFQKGEGKTKETPALILRSLLEVTLILPLTLHLWELIHMATGRGRGLTGK